MHAFCSVSVHVVIQYFIYMYVCVYVFITATGHNKHHEELLENEKYNFRLISKTVHIPFMHKHTVMCLYILLL